LYIIIQKNILTKRRGPDKGQGALLLQSLSVKTRTTRLPTHPVTPNTADSTVPKREMPTVGLRVVSKRRRDIILHHKVDSIAILVKGAVRDEYLDLRRIVKLAKHDERIRNITKLRILNNHAVAQLVLARGHLTSLTVSDDKAVFIVYLSVHYKISILSIIVIFIVIIIVFEKLHAA